AAARLLVAAAAASRAGRGGRRRAAAGPGRAARAGGGLVVLPREAARAGEAQGDRGWQREGVDPKRSRRKHRARAYHRPVRRRPGGIRAGLAGVAGRRYAIIGDGAAGVSAAGALRRLDPACSIAVVSDDPLPAYFRAALTNSLLGELRDEQVWA